MEEIDLKQLLTIFWKKKLIIIICVLAGFILGYTYNTFLMKPKYKATATFTLIANEGKMENDDITLNSKIINNYTEIAKSDSVLNEVISRLNLSIDKKDLKKSISIKVKKDTEYVELSVTLKDRENVANIANTIYEVLDEKIQSIYKIKNTEIVDNATIPDEPCNKSPIKYSAIGAGIGFALAIAIILVMHLLDDSVNDVDEVENKLNLPVIATFSRQDDPASLDWNPKSDYVEGFKALRTNLQFGKNGEDTKTIAVSSIFAGEGKSWVVTNLAIAFAKADYTVLIVDADLRKGIQNQKLEVEQKPGLIQLIKKVENIENFANWNKCIKKTQIDNVYLLPTGGNINDSSELLLSNKLNKIVAELKKGFDIIIFDSTPSALVTDAVVLSRVVDTNIIVTEFQKTKFRDLKKMKTNITNVGGKISGVIINKVDRSESKKYYYYYGEERSLAQNKKYDGRKISYKRGDF